MEIKRIYEEISPFDGYRVLVDRLWPRGITKERSSLNECDKEIAPSAELRKWFGHKMENFAEFSDRYKNELKFKEVELNRIREIAKTQNVTLIYTAHNTAQNQAVVLKEVLENG